MDRIVNTWRLMGAAWRILMRDKALLVFPVVSGIAGGMVVLTFIAPLFGVFGSDAWRAIDATFEGESSIGGYAILFCFYVCSFFVIYFFNAALVDFVVTRLRGGEPTLRDSFREAASCLPQIAMWAIVSATVGIMFRIIEDRAGFLGKVAASLAGVGWTLVTFFVVPMIVIERKGALEAVSDSKDLFGKTWGEQVASGVGYGLIGLLLAIPGIVIAALAMSLLAFSGFRQWASIGAIAVAAGLYLLALAIVMSALQAIFGAVLYLFAKTGKTPEGFDANLLQRVMRPGQERPAT